MNEKLSEIYSHFGVIINEVISNDDYASSPLIAYINDSLCTLSQYIEYVISLKRDSHE